MRRNLILPAAAAAALLGEKWLVLSKGISKIGEQERSEREGKRRERMKWKRRGEERERNASSTNFPDRVSQSVIREVVSQTVSLSSQPLLLLSLIHI